MNFRSAFLSSVGALLILLVPRSVHACAAVGPKGSPVINADQSVIIIWDPATKTQHFIRRASFKSAAPQFGFIVPSPTQPELSKSGDRAFEYLQKLCEPEIIKKLPPMFIGCSGAPKREQPQVKVLETKTIAGFEATVLEVGTAQSLADWLNANGLDYSAAVKKWAEPYVKGQWKFTVFKVATKGKAQQASAEALRISFKTDRPLFPYREPDTRFASLLSASARTLQIHFITDQRYRGELAGGAPWTGQPIWSAPIPAEVRKKSLELLELPESAGPQKWVMTTFVDSWAYRSASGDLYFTASNDQSVVKPLPIVQYSLFAWHDSETLFLNAITFLVAFLIAFKLMRAIRCAIAAFAK